MQLKDKSIFLPVGMLSATLVSMLFLSSASISADVIDEVEVIVPVSCSLLSTSANSYSVTIQNGVYQQPIGETVLKAICNDYNGFAIYASGFSGDEVGSETSNQMIGSNSLSNIITGTATSGQTSNWAMKLTATTGTYTPTISGSSSDLEKETGDPDFSSYTEIPNNFTRVAYRNSSTDSGGSAVGSTITASYAIYISPNQFSGSYVGQVKYILLHPSTKLNHPVMRQLEVTYDAYGGYYDGDPNITTNTVTYDAVCDSEEKEYEIAKTSNLDDEGNKLSSVNLGNENYKEISIPGASKLKIVLNYDYLFNEANPSITDEYGPYYQKGSVQVCGLRDGDNYYCVFYYGTGTQTIIVDNNYAEIAIWADENVTINSAHDYGYFAQVYPLGENDEEYTFTKFSSCTWSRVSGEYKVPYHNYIGNDPVMFWGWYENSRHYDESSVINYLLENYQTTQITVHAGWVS